MLIAAAGKDLVKNVVNQHCGRDEWTQALTLVQGPRLAAEYSIEGSGAATLQRQVAEDVIKRMIRKHTDCGAEFVDRWNECVVVLGTVLHPELRDALDHISRLVNVGVEPSGPDDEGASVLACDLEKSMDCC